MNYMILSGRLRGGNGKLVSPLMAEQLKDMEWRGKRFAAIDPKKSAEAMNLRLRAGVSSVAHEIRQNGGDAEQIFMERLDEKKRGLGPPDEKNDIIPDNQDNDGDE